MALGQQMEGHATSSGLDSPVRTKVVIVTGASRGIGRGIAERLLETGYCVVANSRNITSAKTLQPRDRLKLVESMALLINNWRFHKADHTRYA